MKSAPSITTIGTMNEIILLGMRSQLETRNKILLESTTILAGIVSPPIARIINQYVYGDDQYIHPDAANAFLDGHYEASQDSIGISIKTLEPRCSHDCCETVLVLDISVIVHDWDDSNCPFALNHMWNYIESTYNVEICGYVADCIVEGKTDREEESSYPECKKIARALLDDIRQQIISAGNKSL